MQKILGYIRKACNEFDLISDGDVIAVGLSGGKDSVVLLSALAAYRSFSPQKFGLKAITVDPRFNGGDTRYDELSALCERLSVEYRIVRTDIGQIVFDVRKEQNPCSLCAKMRRGALMEAAQSMGCGKVALGHHNDDVIETFVMKLFYEGQIGCFPPKTYYPDKGSYVIRPLVLAPESAVAACAKGNGLPVIKSACPADKNTAREETKKWLKEREKADRGFKLRLFTALRKNGADGWGYKG